MLPGKSIIKLKLRPKEMIAWQGIKSKHDFYATIKMINLSKNFDIILKNKNTFVNVVGVL